MFMLESHLSPEQSQALQAVQSVAADANLSLFLTGGAMRDMFGGFPIRDLDFTVEGNALKIAKTLTQKAGAKLVDSDEARRSAELVFPEGVRCEVAMARSEKFAKPGQAPRVQPATIHEDLRGRDFTINAIALSLNRASRGLMIDPTNGLADLERKELRQVTNYGFYDDPVRMLRMVRLKARLGFTVEERTLGSYRNARESEMEKNIAPHQLLNEMRLLAFEPDPLACLKAWEEEGLLQLFSPALTGSKLNAPTFQRLAKIKAQIPFASGITIDDYALNLWVATELLTPKEKAALIASLKMLKADTDPWQKLDQRSKKLEGLVKSARLTRASQIYDILKKARGEEMLYLYLNSKLRTVQDRIKNHFTKYLPTMLDVSDSEVAEAYSIDPSSPKFAKAKAERISLRLDGKVRKPAPPPVVEAPPPPPRGMGRASRFR